MEEYRAIKGYEGLYEVSNYGNLKSLDKVIVRGNGVKQTFKEKVLKLQVNPNGYLTARLYKKGYGKGFAIHQLVAMSFLNHIPNGFKIVVDHINSDKLNNNLSNLQLVTNRQNSSKDKNSSESNYTGVYRSCKKWRARAYIDGKLKHLGTFENKLDAFKVYQEKIKQMELS